MNPQNNSPFMPPTEDSNSPPPSAPPSPLLFPDPQQNKIERRLVKIVGIIVLLLTVGIGITAGVLGGLRSQQTTTDTIQTTTTPNTPLTEIDATSLGTAYDSLAKNGIKEFSTDNKTATLQAFANLTNGFSLDQAFFKDSSSVVIGLGLARGSIDHPDQTAGYKAAAYLLATQYVPAVPAGINDKYFVAPKTFDAQVPKILAKYTDTQLTQQVKQTMVSSNVEADLTKALGLTSALAPYTLLVMNFDNSSSQQAAFSKEQYMFGAMPTMWVQGTSTTRYLVMTKDYAKAFLADSNGRERNRVLHELVHSQSAFVRGELGRSIEERRAELFSGDTSAYYDTKQLFIYTNVFSGFDAYTSLKNTPTDSTKFYTQLYQKLGVDGANAFITSAPSAFLGEPSDAMKKAQETFGGMDAVIQRAIAIGKADQAAMDARVEARVQKLYGVFKTKQRTIQDLDDYLGSAYNMPTAAKAMKDYINSH